MTIFAHFFDYLGSVFCFGFFSPWEYDWSPHPRQKSGSTKEDVRNGNGYYSNKRKILAKRDKDKKIFSFSKNLLNRNAIKRKNMGIWGYFAAPKAPRKNFELKRCIFWPFFVKKCRFFEKWPIFRVKNRKVTQPWVIPPQIDPWL